MRDPEADDNLVRLTEPDTRFYSGRYLKTICRTCRTTRPELKDIVMERHRNDEGAFVHCQLCGAEIPGPDEPRTIRLLGGA